MFGCRYYWALRTRISVENSVVFAENHGIRTLTLESAFDILKTANSRSDLQFWRLRLVLICRFKCYDFSIPSKSRKPSIHLFLVWLSPYSWCNRSFEKPPLRLRFNFTGLAKQSVYEVSEKTTCAFLWHLTVWVWFLPFFLNRLFLFVADSQGILQSFLKSWLSYHLYFVHKQTFLAAQCLYIVRV